MIELSKASITAKRHDCAELGFNGKDVAAVFSLDFTPHRCQRRKSIKMPLDDPNFRMAKGPELLKSNWLQLWNHLPPLGSKGSRESLEPPAVAVAVTVCCDACWSRIFCKFSGKASFVRMNVWRAWKILAITM